MERNDVNVARTGECGRALPCGRTGTGLRFSSGKLSSSTRVGSNGAGRTDSSNADSGTAGLTNSMSAGAAKKSTLGVVNLFFCECDCAEVNGNRGHKRDPKDGSTLLSVKPHRIHVFSSKEVDTPLQRNLGRNRHVVVMKNHIDSDAAGHPAWGCIIEY